VAVFFLNTVYIGESKMYWLPWRLEYWKIESKRYVSYISLCPVYYNADEDERKLSNLRSKLSNIRRYYGMKHLTLTTPSDSFSPSITAWSLFKCQSKLPYLLACSLSRRSGIFISTNPLIGSFSCSFWPSGIASKAVLTISWHRGFTPCFNGGEPLWSFHLITLVVHLGS